MYFGFHATLFPASSPMAKAMRFTKPCVLETTFYEETPFLGERNNPQTPCYMSEPMRRNVAKFSEE